LEQDVKQQEWGAQIGGWLGEGIFRNSHHVDDSEGNYPLDINKTSSWKRLKYWNRAMSTDRFCGWEIVQYERATGTKPFRGKSPVKEEGTEEKIRGSNTGGEAAL